MLAAVLLTLSIGVEPNVVVVLVDDLGWRDLGCQGSTYYETPHIDRLASQGVRFTDAYAAAAVCSPTRAALMTGKWPARLGITDWIRARFQRPRKPRKQADRPLVCPPNPFELPGTEVTLAEVLREAGYVTCHVGKWHLGDVVQGFDFNLGGCDYGQPPSYFDPYKNKRLAGIPTLSPRKEGEYLTDREADEAVRFIRKHKDRRFFLYYAPYAVHTPIQAKADLTAKYRARPKPWQGWAKYAAMIESVDDAVGRVMATLHELKLTGRTLVIFTSDNGGLLPVTSNAPLRSGKGYAYEGGIRVPLIVRGPGVTPGVARGPVTTVDLFATVVEAVGLKRPSDGVSVFEGRDELFWHFPHYRHKPGPYSIIRSGNWKLIRFWEGPVFELYDLANDLSEKNDLAAKHLDRVKELDAKLLAHLKSVGAKQPKPRD